MSKKPDKEVKQSEAWYNKYRPKLFKDVVGQKEAVPVLMGMVKNGIPHAILLTGPSGTGKTTICRIMKEKLNCGEGDYREINVSDYKGIEMVRDIRKEKGRYGISGGCRVYVLDEAHEMTKGAQNALLKLLEDEQDHVYFMIATTDAGSLLQTLKTRCKQIHLKQIPLADLQTLVKDVAKKEQVSPAISPTVMDALVNGAGGSARQILNDLEKIAPLTTDDARVEALMPAGVQATAMAIVNALIPFKGRGSWKEASEAIMTCEEDLEKVRQIVLSCAAGQLRRAQSPATGNRAYLVIVAFEAPFFHSRKAGMLAAAWQVFSSPNK